MNGFPDAGLLPVVPFATDIPGENTTNRAEHGTPNGEMIKKTAESVRKWIFTNLPKGYAVQLYMRGTMEGNTGFSESYRLHGTGNRLVWAKGGPRETGVYSQDDFLVDSTLGIAVFAAGHGVFSQGNVAAKLAVWSLWGEVRKRTGSQGLLEAVRKGFSRASEAISRLSWNWPPGLVQPSASLAVLGLDGNEALVAPVGLCRVIRLGAAGLVPLNSDHGMHSGHAEITEAVHPGDRFLLAGPSLFEKMTDESIAACHLGDSGETSDLGLFAQKILANAHYRSSDYGNVSLVVVDVVPEGTARVPEPMSAGSREPHLSWLYHPGEPLPQPPASWRLGADFIGPGKRWQEEVAELVMAPDEIHGQWGT